MQTMTFTLTGAVNVSVTATQLDDGTLKFDLTVLDDTGSIGDLNGVFFDLADDSVAGSLSATGADVTGSVFKANSVTKVDSYDNMNGAVINEFGKFDAGVQFGTAGIGSDDIRQTSFVLSSSDGPLSLADVALQDFGARLTSVGEEGGSRNGSLKLGGVSSDVPEDPGPGDGGAPHATANDDTMIVDLAQPDYFDFVNGDHVSVLDNDTNADGTAYDGGIPGTYFNSIDDYQILTVTGSNGGVLDIYDDGSVDFHDNGDFTTLADGATAETSFTYAIDGGDTATVTATVIGHVLIG